MSDQRAILNIDNGLIDDRADVHPTATIANDVKIGPWSVIGPNVEIGEGSEIASHVVIECNTKMGKRNKISSFAAIGCAPQDLSYKNESTWLEMGDDNVVREYVTLSRGSAREEGITRIGNKNCFLAYSHVAHDCIIGNEVLFTNHAALAGHVTVDDYAILGAFTAVHQFCRIGAYSFLSRAAQVPQDVLPYMIIVGIPGKPCGLNLVGLRRHGFSSDTIAALKRAYRIIYRRDLKMKEVEAQLIEMAKEFPEIQLIVEMIQNTKRGVTRPSEDI